MEVSRQGPAKEGAEILVGFCQQQRLILNQKAHAFTLGRNGKLMVMSHEETALETLPIEWQMGYVWKWQRHA